MEPNISYIKELMDKKGLSLRGLALKAGVSAGALSNVFNGKRGAGKVIINGFIKAFPEESIERLFFFPNM
jgi:lambda repressor-like predicted transcriptional regulator